MRGGRVVGVALAALAVVMVVSAPAAATASGGVALDTSVGGARLSSATGSHPVRLDPVATPTITLRVRNGGRSTVAVSRLSFAGQVVGLTFFDYETAVRLSVPPGQTGTLAFPLDLSGLDGQATGLLPASMTLFDGSHNRVATEATVVDVRGSVASVYGLFGLGIAILTILLLLNLVVALARHRLPDNRFRRALRFVPLGAGVALVATFTLSVARLFVPTLAHVLPVLVIAVAATFAIGYLTPTPGDDGTAAPDEEPEPEPEAIGVEHHTIGVAAPRRTSTRSTRRTSTRSTQDIPPS